MKHCKEHWTRLFKTQVGKIITQPKSDPLKFMTTKAYNPKHTQLNSWVNPFKTTTIKKIENF